MLVCLLVIVCTAVLELSGRNPFECNLELHSIDLCAVCISSHSPTQLVARMGQVLWILLKSIVGKVLSLCTSLLHSYVGMLAYIVLASLRHQRSNITEYPKLLS